MLYLMERRIENTFVYLKGGNYYRVDEVLKFDFDENKYKLVDFTIAKTPQLEGGEQNE